MCKVQFHPSILLQQQESRYRPRSNVIQGIDKGVSIFGSKRLICKTNFCIDYSKALIYTSLKSMDLADTQYTCILIGLHIEF